MSLDVADIRDHWPRIRELVARAMRGDEDLPEEVYAACRAGRACLYISVDAAFVLRWQSKSEIRVWIAVGFGAPGVLDRYDEELARIGREAGATEMTFTTCRKGFERALPKTWRQQWTTYSRSV